MMSSFCFENLEIFFERGYYRFSKFNRKEAKSPFCPVSVMFFYWFFNHSSKKRYQDFRTSKKFLWNNSDPVLFERVLFLQCFVCLKIFYGSGTYPVMFFKVHIETASHAIFRGHPPNFSSKVWWRKKIIGISFSHWSK